MWTYRLIMCANGWQQTIELSNWTNKSKKEQKRKTLRRHKRIWPQICLFFYHFSWKCYLIGERLCSSHMGVDHVYIYETFIYLFFFLLSLNRISNFRLFLFLQIFNKGGNEEKDQHPFLLIRIRIRIVSQKELTIFFILSIYYNWTTLCQQQN